MVGQPWLHRPGRIATPLGLLPSEPRPLTEPATLSDGVRSPCSHSAWRAGGRCVDWVVLRETDRHGHGRGGLRDERRYRPGGLRLRKCQGRRNIERCCWPDGRPEPAPTRDAAVPDASSDRDASADASSPIRDAGASGAEVGRVALDGRDVGAPDVRLPGGGPPDGGCLAGHALLNPSVTTTLPANTAITGDATIEFWMRRDGAGLGTSSFYEIWFDGRFLGNPTMRSAWVSSPCFLQRTTYMVRSTKPGSPALPANRRHFLLGLSLPPTPTPSSCGTSMKGWARQLSMPRATTSPGLWWAARGLRASCAVPCAATWSWTLQSSPMTATRPRRCAHTV